MKTKVTAYEYFSLVNRRSEKSPIFFNSFFRPFPGVCCVNVSLSSKAGKGGNSRFGFDGDYREAKYKKGTRGKEEQGTCIHDAAQEKVEIAKSVEVVCRFFEELRPRVGFKWDLLEEEAHDHKKEQCAEREERGNKSVARKAAGENADSDVEHAAGRDKQPASHESGQ